MEKEVERKGLKYSATEDKKEGKSKMFCVVWLPGERVASIQQRRRSDVG